MLQNISEKYNQTSRSQTYEDNNISKINYSEIFSKLFTKQKIVSWFLCVHLEKELKVWLFLHLD